MTLTRGTAELQKRNSSSSSSQMLSILGCDWFAPIKTRAASHQWPTELKWHCQNELLTILHDRINPEVLLVYNMEVCKDNNSTYPNLKQLYRFNIPEIFFANSPNATTKKSGEASETLKMMNVFHKSSNIVDSHSQMMSNSTSERGKEYSYSTHDINDYFAIYLSFLKKLFIIQISRFDRSDMKCFSIDSPECEMIDVRFIGTPDDDAKEPLQLSILDSSGLLKLYRLETFEKMSPKTKTRKNYVEIIAIHESNIDSAINFSHNYFLHRPGVSNFIDDRLASFISKDLSGLLTVDYKKFSNGAKHFSSLHNLQYLSEILSENSVKSSSALDPLLRSYQVRYMPQRSGTEIAAKNLIHVEDYCFIFDESKLLALRRFPDNDVHSIQFLNDKIIVMYHDLNHLSFYVQTSTNEIRDLISIELDERFHNDAFKIKNILISPCSSFLILISFPTDMAWNKIKFARMNLLSFDELFTKTLDSTTLSDLRRELSNDIILDFTQRFAKPNSCYSMLSALFFRQYFATHLNYAASEILDKTFDDSEIIIASLTSLIQIFNPDDGDDKRNQKYQQNLQDKCLMVLRQIPNKCRREKFDQNFRTLIATLVYSYYTS